MSRSTPIQWTLRVLCYILGQFFLALGVAFSVNSNLGVSPVNSLPYVVSQISGTTLSTCVILIFCLFILLQVLILRQKFRLVNLLQILFSTLFGYFVDLAKWLLGDFLPSAYPCRLAMLGISIVLIAVGVVFYIEVDLVPMPMEGLSLAISNQLSIPFHNMKIMVDCVVVALGAVLSLLFLHRLDGIREGTLLTAVLVGKVMAFVKGPLCPLLRRLCFSAPDANEPSTAQDMEQLEGVGER